MPPGRPLLSLLNRVVLPVCAGGLVALGGCQTVGPNSIRMGREHYNSILQATSMEQTMSNIVRLYKHEPPMFLDVTEVDATLNFGGSITAAGTNIGAKRGTSGGTLAGQVGSVGGAVQYSETPTIRYQPLLGQALVAQLVTPVSVDALGLMYDSYWDLGPLLDFSSAYLTPDASKFYPALNTILELNHRGALWVAAAKSSLTPQAPTQDQIAPGQRGQQRRPGVLPAALSGGRRRRGRTQHAADSAAVGEDAAHLHRHPAEVHSAGRLCGPRPDHGQAGAARLGRQHRQARHRAGQSEDRLPAAGPRLPA
jgi:hypothetical protein